MVLEWYENGESEQKIPLKILRDRTCRPHGSRSTVSMLKMEEHLGSAKGAIQVNHRHPVFY